MSGKYFDNYDFICKFANDSFAYRNMTGYDSKYTGHSVQQIMANGLDGGDIQHPIDDPIGRPGYWSGALRSQGVGGEDDSDGHTRSEGGTEFLYYFHKDHLGSSMLLTDGTGSISRQVEYLPYGEVFLEKLHSSDLCCISL